MPEPGSRRCQWEDRCEASGVTESWEQSQGVKVREDADSGPVAIRVLMVTFWSTLPREKRFYNFCARL